MTLRRVGVGSDVILCAKIAAGCKLEEAADAARMSVRTARRRMQQPGFQAQLDAVRSELQAETIGALRALQVKAVATLEELMDFSPAPVRERAARAVLTLGERLGADAGMRARLAELEARLAELADLEERLAAAESDSRDRS